MALDKLTMLSIQNKRSAERALTLMETDTDGSGSYDANGNKVTNLGTPTASTDAATKAYVDAAVVGGELPDEVTGNVDMNSFTLQNMADADGNGKPVGYGQIGDGLEWNTGKVRVKLDGTTITRSASGIAVNPSALSSFSTGDIKATLKTVADAGWVMMDDGTIGNAASSATTRANADTEDLFTLLWTNCADAQCAVSGGRGASAAADFAANKRIALPKILGRAIGAAGAGSGLTSRALAETTGAETHRRSTRMGSQCWFST